MLKRFFLVAVSLAFVACAEKSKSNLNEAEFDWDKEAKAAHEEGYYFEFSDYCHNSKDPEIRKTLTVLMKRVGSDDCSTAEGRLRTWPDYAPLLLNEVGITDLTPIAQMYQLKRLELSYNKDLSDIRPLQYLEDLESVKLHGTNVRDISPLANMEKMTQKFSIGIKAENVDKSKCPTDSKNPGLNELCSSL